MTMSNTLGIVFASLLGGALIDILGTNGMLMVGSIISVVGCVLVFISTTKEKKEAI